MPESTRRAIEFGRLSGCGSESLSQLALLLNSEVIAGVIAFEHGCVVAELLGVSRTHHCLLQVCVKAVLAARAWPELVCSDLEQ